VKNPPVFLRFKDGKLSSYKEELSKRIGEELAKIQPDIVITFGPEGATHHPDHIAVSDATDAAFDDQKSCKELCIWPSRRNAMQLWGMFGRKLCLPFLFRECSQQFHKLCRRPGRFRQRRIDSFFCYDTQFNQNYRTAWLKFTEQYPYEEFIVARIKGQCSNVASIQDLFSKKL